MSISPFDRPAMFGMRVRHLLDIIAAQLDESLRQFDCDLKSTTTGIVILLDHRGALSLIDIANHLRYSHQLASQRVAWLQQHRYVTMRDDPADGRRRLVSLTRSGRIQAARLAACSDQLDEVFTKLFDEIAVDTHRAVIATIGALDQRPLSKRLSGP